MKKGMWQIQNAQRPDVQQRIPALGPRAVCWLPLQPGKIFKAEVGNEKDYIATRVSYNLDLGGPSFTVNSACSSGLVAVAQVYFI